MSKKITVTVFKVTKLLHSYTYIIHTIMHTYILLIGCQVSGETNTDDLSPAPDAWSRPDIPLHALAMLKNARDGIEPTYIHTYTTNISCFLCI